MGKGGEHSLKIRLKHLFRSRLHPRWSAARTSGKGRMGDRAQDHMGPKEKCIAVAIDLSDRNILLFEVFIANKFGPMGTSGLQLLKKMPQLR